MSSLCRVIVGASGSPNSVRALRYAADLARRNDAMLIPVLAWTPPGGEMSERRLPYLALRKLWQKAASDKLLETLASAWGTVPPDLTVRPLVARGGAGPVLVEVANSLDDVLVLGAGRRGPLARFRGGRVTRYCLSHADCAVLAVPPATLDGEVSRGLRLRRKELSLDQALREWGKAPA